MSGATSGGGGYGEKTYWDARYATEEKYDWYLHYDQFKHQLLPHLHVQDNTTTPAATDEAQPAPGSDTADPALSPPPSSSSSSPPPAVVLRARAGLRVLIVGCGNSELSAAMADDGFTDVVSIDYSAVVIDKMIDTYKQHKPQLQFAVQDVRAMTFDSAAFDVLIDKGTLDAILCGAESARHATAMLSECARVMSEDGVLCIITYGAPSSRLSYLEQTRYGWDVTYEVLGGTRYLYVCRKSKTHPPTNGTTTDKEGDGAKS